MNVCKHAQIWSKLRPLQSKFGLIQFWIVSPHFAQLVPIEWKHSITATGTSVQWRHHGGQAGQLAPTPKPLIGHTVRPMQILDFHVKNGDRLTGYAPMSYMHQCYGRHSLVLQIQKRGSCRSCWKSYFSRPSVKLRDPLGSFSPGNWPSQAEHFILFWYLYV